ncbi:MAG: hypothetical protein VW438_01715, partial [Euryarchaeota archaeon]
MLVEFAKRYPGFSLLVGIFVGGFLYLSIGVGRDVVRNLLILDEFFTPKDWAYLLVPLGSFFLFYFGSLKRNRWLVVVAIRGFVAIIGDEVDRAGAGVELR